MQQTQVTLEIFQNRTHHITIGLTTLGYVVCCQIRTNLVSRPVKDLRNGFISSMLPIPAMEFPYPSRDSNPELLGHGPSLYYAMLPTLKTAMMTPLGVHNINEYLKIQRLPQQRYNIILVSSSFCPPLPLLSFYNKG